MSKLDDIITDATSTSYCAGQDWSKDNPTIQYVDKASDEAKDEIKALMLELIDDTMPVPSRASLERLKRKVAEL